MFARVGLRILSEENRLLLIFSSTPEFSEILAIQVQQCGQTSGALALVLIKRPVGLKSANIADAVLDISRTRDSPPSLVNPRSGGTVSSCSCGT